MIQVANISKSYHDANREIQVFANLSFTIDVGQTVALMGQSGAGKSTLLHLLGGFDRVDAGDIDVNQCRISKMSDTELSVFRRKHLGMVFQQFNLIPSLNALDNITFTRRLNGMPAEDEHTRQLIAVLGLDDRLHHYPAQLSGGEQQRVAIARALASRPDLILADEPTGNLDEETAAGVMQQLMQAVTLDRSTLLLVTHSQATAAHLGAIWRLEKGRLIC